MLLTGGPAGTPLHRLPDVLKTPHVPRARETRAAQLFGVARRGAPVVNELYVDYGAMLSQMDHVCDVLNAIDVYLIETHGENAEWEAEMNSW